MEIGNDVYLIDNDNLRNYNFFNADLRFANLTGADLTGANLSAADLTDANLTNANLTGVQLATAWVQVVTDIAGGTSFELHIPSLRNANLTNANLTDANLVGADLTDANLTNANLTGVQLTTFRAQVFTGHAVTDIAGGTSFELHIPSLRNANLTNANLTDANLVGADLSGAILEGADLSGANIYKATGLDVLTSDQLASTVSKVPTPTIDLNDADGTLVAYEIKDWDGLSGTAYPNTTLTLVSTYTKNSNSQSYQILTDANGIWRLTKDDVGYNPPEGTYSLSITAKDGDGLVSEQAATTLTFDLGTAGTDFDAPTISLNDPNNDVITMA